MCPYGRKVFPHMSLRIQGGGAAEDTKLISKLLIIVFEAGGRDGWNVAKYMARILERAQEKNKSRAGHWLPDKEIEAKRDLNEVLEFVFRMTELQLKAIKKVSPDDSFRLSSLNEQNLFIIADDFAKHVMSNKRSRNAALVFSWTRERYPLFKGFYKYLTDQEAPDRGFKDFITKHSDVIIDRKKEQKQRERVNKECQEKCTNYRVKKGILQYDFEPRVAMNECIQLCRTPSTALTPNPLYRDCKKGMDGCEPYEAPNDWNVNRADVNIEDLQLTIEMLSHESRRS